MERIIVDHTAYPLHSIDAIPARLKMQQIHGSTIQYGHGHFGKVICQQLVLGSFEMVYRYYQVLEDCTFHFRSRKQYLGVHIILKNDFSYALKEMGEVVFREDQCNVIYLPAVDLHASFRKGREYISLDLYYKPAQVKQYAALFPFSTLFIQDLQGRKAACLHLQAQHISFAIQCIVHEMIHSNYKGNLRKTYLKVKASELLLLVMELLTAKKGAKVKLSQYHVEKLHEARKFITDHYHQHYSINEMAKRYGMNTTTFKVGFRHEFGAGPFEYLDTIRMARAIELLKEGQLTINRIANDIGYKSSGSFIKAFKNRFNYTPGQARKKGG